MADVIDYTPAQLRALADEMDGGSDARPGNVRRITVDGIAIDVDMRGIGDIRTLRKVREAQKGGSDAAFAALDLFDAILGTQRERVERELQDDDGYLSSERYMTFCSHVFEAVGAKN